MSTHVKTPVPGTQSPKIEPENGPATRPWAFRDLPPFPGVALKLLDLLDEDEVSIKTVSDLVRSDPVLVGEILRVSNSAMYGVSRQIDNVAHALVVLGTETVKRLALTASLGRFCADFIQDQTLRVCWDHSVACALVSQELAALLDEPKERAYAAGLLHDIGRLAILSCYSKEYGNMLSVAREHDFDELEAERQLFDIDHCDAGAILAGEWKLPEDFVEAIQTHHTREIDDTTIPSLVAAGNAIADRLGFSVLNVNEFSPSIEEVVARLPFKDSEEIMESIEALRPTIDTALRVIIPRKR